MVKKKNEYTKEDLKIDIGWFGSLGVNNEEAEQYIINLLNRVNRLKEELTKYKKGFNLLMDYWDSLPEEERENIDKQLREIGV